MPVPCFEQIANRSDPAEYYLQDSAWLREAGEGALRGHAGCHGLSGALRLRQRRQWQRLGQCLENRAWLGKTTCKMQNHNIRKPNHAIPAMTVHATYLLCDSVIETLRSAIFV